MFLITQNAQQCKSALLKLKEQLNDIPSGPIHIHTLGKYQIGWFGAKPSDNIHIYEKGIVIGKIDFAEKTVMEPIYHNVPLPSSLHTLLLSVVIRQKNGSVLVEPNGSTNVYVGDSCVSDMQLLIADVLGAKPRALGIATLGSVGFFPGNMTLFDEIQKIPLIYAYNLDTGQNISIGAFEIQKNDDIAMIERLTEIVPRGITQYIALSGGYDSRFVLGCLVRAGIEPQIVHISDKEDEIVAKIAEELRIPIEICPRAEMLPDYLYTIMTDAQIYFRGGNSSQIRKIISPESLYHSGNFVEASIKAPWDSAWKIPGPKKSLRLRLVKYGLLSTTPDNLQGLRNYSSKEQLTRALVHKLEFEESYCDFRTQKALTNWFYHMNRGIRWSPATMADLSYYSYSVYLLADLTALSTAISSSAWSNLRKERARALNHKLLPSVYAPYFDGYPAKEQNPLLSQFDKIKYEYIDRFFTRMRKVKEFSDKASSIRSLFKDEVSIDCCDEFSDYFTEPYLKIINGHYSYAQKRAATTLCHVLNYLDS